MKLVGQHRQGWLRVFSVMVVITAAVFLLRNWILSSPDEGSMVPAQRSLQKDHDLRIHYHQRPPYYVETAKGVTGLCAAPVARAFKAAGIPFEWIQTPPKRQLYLLKQNPARDCLIGWFKTPERAQYARYSTAIYQDQPTVALVRRGDPRFPERCKVVALLSIPDIVMLSRPGYSYGSFVDNELARISPHRMNSGVDSSEWLSILYTRRADFLLIAPEEADHLLGRTQLPVDAFRYVTLTDMPPGNRRYVMFSRAVPVDVVDRFNTAFLATSAAESVAAYSGDRK